MKKKIENMLLTKVCMFYGLSETIFVFGFIKTSCCYKKHNQSKPITTSYELYLKTPRRPRTSSAAEKEEIITREMSTRANTIKFGPDGTIAGPDTYTLSRTDV